MTEINIFQLGIAFEKLIEKLKKERVHKIVFENDLYRIIPTDQWEVYKEKVSAVEIGSLYEDIDSILKLVDDSERPCTYLDFDRVASILRMISELQNPASSSSH